MLRALLPALAACVVGAATARADAILYATAATTGEITSYCVGPNGGLDPEPRQRIPTNGNAPSRLAVATFGDKQFLYAAENDRVEVFEIGQNGVLTRQGRIPARPFRDDPDAALTGMNPHDLVVTENPPMLYVPQRSQDRIAAFPLDSGTGLSTTPTGFCNTSKTCANIADCDTAVGESCVQDRCTVAPVTCSTDAECGAGMACRLTSGANPEGRCVTTCDPREVACGDAANATCSGLSDQSGSSCILGSVPSDWEDVEVANGLLYAARSVTRGEVMVFQLASDGNVADGTVLVDQSVGSDTSAECGVTRGCTTGVSCTVDADCAAASTDQRCVSGSCVDLTSTCTRDKDCAADQTCTGFNPCNQDFKRYPVSSANCTTPVPLTDVDGNAIVTRGGLPITVRAEITPYSRRRRLNGAGPLIVNDGLLYVSERFRRAISVLKLCDQSMPVVCPAPDEPVPTGEKNEPCTCPDQNQDRAPDVPDLCPPGGLSVDAKFNSNGICTARDRQTRGIVMGTKKDGRPKYKGGRTRNDLRYNALVLARGSDRSSILGAQFLQGRIDGYRLQSDGRIPRRATRETVRNFRTSPFQMFVWNGVLYVGGGEIDQVQAYRINEDGLPRDRKPYAQTVRLRDTFPNAVIVADLPAGGTCPVP
jgi:hypothetical protein